MGPMRVDGDDAIATAVESAELVEVQDIEAADGSRARFAAMRSPSTRTTPPTTGSP